MEINWQPYLQGSLIELRPMKTSDFENLFKAASDPLIWEQHPDTYRYKRETFKKYFESGIQSKGALLVLDNSNEDILGSSRFYDYDAERNQIAIGYTFLLRRCWGKPYNKELKNLMINYAFNYVDNILFFIGINNIRSRKAIEKTGAIFESQDEATAIYKIIKEAWYKKSARQIS